MAITKQLASVPAVPGDTIMGRRVVIAHVPTGGSQINLRGKMASNTRSVEKVKRRAPNSSNEVTVDRTDVIFVEDTIRIGLDEFGAVMLANFQNQAYSDGEWRLWIVDPKDATGTARWVSKPFNGIGHLEGETRWEDGGYAETSLVIEPNGIVQFLRDQDVTGSS
jgi:hypothetical protein